LPGSDPGKMRKEFFISYTRMRDLASNNRVGWGERLNNFDFLINLIKCLIISKVIKYFICPKSKENKNEMF